MRALALFVADRNLIVRTTVRDKCPMGRRLCLRQQRGL